MSKDKKNIKRRASSRERFWEILPGMLTWLTLAAMIMLSWQAPYIVSYFIMLYSLVWLTKSIHASTHLMHTFRHLQAARSNNWMARLKDFENPAHALHLIEKELAELKAQRDHKTFRSRRLISKGIKNLKLRRQELKEIIARGTELPDWRSIWHLVVIPTYNEPVEVLRQSLNAIKSSKYPLDRVMVVVGIEERAGKEGQEKATALSTEFSGAFGRFWTVTHPDGIAGEAKVKSANATYALKQILPKIGKMNIPIKNIIVSNFDSDTQPDPSYLAVLTEAYIKNPKRLRASYQPVPVFNNNLWESSTMARLSAMGTSFWQMIEASRTHRLVSFSSHSIPLQAVVDVNGWDVTRISEDSRIFWQCYMHYQGAYYVVPLSTTVSMDAVQTQGWWNTMIALYKQKRRWAWGIENLAYLGTNFTDKNCRISWWKRIAHSLRMVEGHHSWATTAVILALGGWLPSFLGGPDFANTILGQNFSMVTRFLLTLALLGIVVSIYISTKMLPERPKHISKKRNFNLVVQWLFTPLATVFFGSIPAIDAQTRLLFGNYMEFQVMPKIRPPKANKIKKKSLEPAVESVPHA